MSKYQYENKELPCYENSEIRQLSKKLLTAFRIHLIENEHSQATIEKYSCDLKYFMNFAAGRPVDKALTMDYKAHLKEHYALNSANSIIAALNAFLKFAGWQECAVRQFRVQKKAFCSEDTFLTRAEYERLVRAAHHQGDHQLELIMQTICSTGIRISELRFITVEAVQLSEAQINCKGKVRTVFIVPELRKKLQGYIKASGIANGSVFLGKRGRPMNRSLIWKKMKDLCKHAGVDPKKVFPHNLRHLFARLFYELEKDIAKLADILGHTSINTTRIYMISTGREHRKKMQRLRLIL